MTFLKKNDGTKPESNAKSNSSASDSSALVKQESQAIATSEGGKLAKNASMSDLPEPPVILEKPAFWARALVWTILGMTVTAVTWASLAQIEEAVPAVGKLEPKGAVKEIQAPTGGVIRSVEVKDAQVVKEGDLLVTLDPTASTADKEALTKAKSSLLEENRNYQALLDGFESGSVAGFQATAEFRLTQQRLLVASQAEFQTRVASAELDVRQLQTQLAQAEQQLVSSRNIVTSNEGVLLQTQSILETNRKILDDMRPAAETGALSKLQYRQQEQRVQSAEADILNRQADISRARADVERLTREVERLTSAVSQAQEKLNNTISLTRKDILSRIADNQKRISDIEGQLTKAALSLSYQEIRAPISGKVFDLKVGPGNVISGVNANQPILKIVPNENLVASVFITNRDIGFVREGMPVDVRIDSFPNLEFGSVKGKLVTIGSDALPPDQQSGRQFYAFPAKIELETQTLNIGDCKIPKPTNCKKIPIQSGMSVSSSILIRKRSVISIFLSQFTSKAESLKYVR